MQQRRQSGTTRLRHTGGQREAVEDPALDAAHGLQPANLRYIGGLAGPGRDRSGSGHHEHLPGAAAQRRQAAVVKKLREPRAFQRIEFAAALHKMQELRAHGRDTRLARLQAREQSEESKFGQSLGARKREHQFFFGPGSLAEGGSSGIGNCATLAPSSATILLTPCLRTSSIRTIDCKGR